MITAIPMTPGMSGGPSGCGIIFARGGVMVPEDDCGPVLSAALAAITVLNGAGADDAVAGIPVTMVASLTSAVAK